jgi:hypothetical protein
MSFSLDPQALAEAHAAEYKDFRPPNVDGLSDAVMGYPGNTMCLIDDAQLKRTYVDALMDLHFLVDEYRFEAVLALALLQDYAIKRDRGDAPALKLSGNKRLDEMPWIAETVVVMQRYAREPPNPQQIFVEPHQQIAGGRILSRWFAAQLIDSALYRGVAACDRLAILLRCRAGLPVETTKRGERRQPSFTAAAMKDIGAVLGTTADWDALCALTSNPLFDFTKQLRNGFTHERRTPSELHGERGIVYGALDGTDEEFAPAMDASTHYALAPAFYNEVLIRAVEHTRTVIIASSDPAWRRERGIGDDPEESERATRPPDPS